MSSTAESANDLASGPQHPLLDVRDLRVRFRMLDGTIFAVNGISLHLDRGETLGLVGESGSGKSVTSLALMRLLPPEPAAEIGGEIQFDGRDIANLSEKQMRPLRGRDIAMVFQDPMTSLNPVLRIGEQVEETIKAHREIDTAGARARATELLRLVGIADPERQLERYPHEFSGGMRQRVMIAMALALRTEAPHRRRTHDGSRRDDPGASARAAAEAHPGDGDGAHPDHARPRRGGADDADGWP